jgi:hypothetical protein
MFKNLISIRFNRFSEGKVRWQVIVTFCGRCGFAFGSSREPVTRQDVI